MKDAAKEKAQISYNKKQVCFLTGISENELMDFRLDMAKAWADHYWKHQVNVDALLTSEGFWAWWNWQWNSIDDKAIIQDMYGLNPESRYAYYRQTHQYVFDNSSNHQRHLMQDFADMLPSFKAEIAQTISA